ncbi:hypothetical protein I5R65_00510 [Herbaspirillum sp. AP02]|uniref:hypothetical protein n=1 Tax=unclassified Herbaspirillum TaxID=2624150 RepID=UPI0015DA0143|nr:hypothetical protein [Herbaspirillum sp. AP02]NZD70118.1 hypothetical protein [Herbaspirillum sp. AP21]
MVKGLPDWLGKSAEGDEEVKLLRTTFQSMPAENSSFNCTDSTWISRLTWRISDLLTCSM